MSRKALCLNKLKKHDESINLLDKCLSVRKDDDIEKLLSIVKVEKDIYDKAMSLVNKTNPEFEYNLYNNRKIDGFVSQMQSKSEEMKINESDVEEISKIIKNDDNKVYFIQKGGLELIFLIFEKYLFMIDIISLFNEEEKYTIQVNNVKGYNKLVLFLIHSEKNELNTITISYIKKIVSILEDASQYEFVRKSLNLMKNFHELFRITFLKFDLCDLKVINNSDNVLILLNLYTFISNVCFSSNDVRKKIVDIYDKCLSADKLEKFTTIFDFKSILHRNLLESFINLLSNLACDNRIRDNLNHFGLKFFSFLIELCGNSINQMYDSQDLYEKILCLLFNISHSNQQLLGIIVDSSLVKTLGEFLSIINKYKLLVIYLLIRLN